MIFVHTKILFRRNASNSRSFYSQLGTSQGEKQFDARRGLPSGPSPGISLFLVSIRSVLLRVGANLTVIKLVHAELRVLR
jgi:hypothetical protein